MSDLVLSGILDLSGNLELSGDGGKLKIGAAELEALVVCDPKTDPPQSTSAVPPPFPPPPPPQCVPTAWVDSTPNATVKTGGKAIVAGGTAAQGLAPSPAYPGKMNPSVLNPTVTIGGVAINVLGDSAVFLPPVTAPATFSAASGQ